MDKPRFCGCKGYRSCLLCEKDYGITKPVTIDRELDTYVYCPFCNKAWPGWNLNDYKSHPNHEGIAIDFPGIYIDLNFLSDLEEDAIIKGVDNMQWDLSQSGRRKQNFGPKCNFKKQKLRLGEFNGFPKFSEFIQKKFKFVEILNTFQTIEQCSLEYNPERGASIDPHVDDCWIWGERIVTVNLLSDSVLTMTKYNGSTEKYNLNCVKQYPAVLDCIGNFNKSKNEYKINVSGDERKYPIVRIPMPKKSLLIMYNAARYDWEHQILREDITERRVCLAYREFTPPYLPNGSHYNISEHILKNALNFFNT